MTMPVFGPPWLVTSDAVAAPLPAAAEHHQSRPAPWDGKTARIRDLILVSWHAAGALGYSWQDTGPSGGPGPELLAAAGVDAATVRRVFSDAATWVA